MSDAKSPPELSMDEILATIRRIIAEDEQPGGASAAGGLHRETAARDSADDIVELTEALNEDGSVRHLAPIGGTSRIAALREPAPPAAAVEPAPEPAPSLADAPRPPAVPGPPDMPGQTAAAAVAPAPSEPSPERELQLGAADRTLEEIVRDLLRPVLQTWLDEHLPEIVERLLQAEISRARKSGPT
jgi:hypothetical protein